MCLVISEANTFNVGNNILALEDNRDAKFLTLTARDVKNEDITSENADQSSTEKTYTIIGEARSNTPGGIYPHNTTFVYKYEMTDTWGTFDHEAGKFYAPTDGDYKIRFYCQRTCTNEVQNIYIFKNGSPIAQFHCFGSGWTYGWVEHDEPLVADDTIEVYSGIADIIMDIHVFKMEVSVASEARGPV